MPKNDYPSGHIIPWGGNGGKVNENMLIMGLLKKRLGSAPRFLE
jgi:hypothetical protein